MDKVLLPAQEVPVLGEYDVVVAGGGCAGLAAAVACARIGARTLILERFPFFGGTATASLMANIVGIRNQVEPNELQVLKGIGQELLLRLLSGGDACVTKNAYIAKGRPHSNTKDDLSYSFAFNTEAFKREAQAMVEESGCDILFHVFVSDVIVEDNRLKGLVIETKAGRRAVLAKAFVDATGDGDVAFRAGIPFWQTRHEEAKRLNDTLMYKVGGFDPDHVSVESCVFDDSMVLWGPNPGGHDATDPWELTRMELQLRRDVHRQFEELKQAHPDLKDAYIADTGVLMGIRQTRFFECRYKITGEDVLNGARFDDVIAVGCNPVIHYYGYRRFLTHEGYDIPFRCLVPKALEGLLIAGRCICSDQIAFESWRAMSHILCIGEAAGTAAALAVRHGVSPGDVDIRALQDQLVTQGAEIGQNRTL